MISASRAGLRRSDARRGSSSFVHSGIVDPRDQTHRAHERLPGAPLPVEHAPALGGERIEAPPALAGLLHPPAAQPATLLQPVEQRIERRHVELELSVRPRLDQLADLIAMPLARVEDRENDQLRRAFLQLAVEHPFVDISHSHTCYSQSCGGGKRQESSPSAIKGSITGISINCYNVLW